ncbi:MAG: hypothetical protein ACK5PB_19900 [Pirellula sp.]
MFPQQPSLSDLKSRPIRWVRLLAFFVWFTTVVMIGRSFGQPSQPPALPSDLDGLPPGLLPDAVFYQNENGDWVRLLVDRVKEFESFLRSKSDPAPVVLPSFRLEDSSLELTLDSKLVRIKGTVVGELEQAAEKWFEIPIGFSNVQVLPTEQSDPSRIVPATGSGYVWRHGPSPPGRLTHTFYAVSNITPSTDGGSIRIDLPNSPTRIRFPLSPADWDVSVSGSGGEVVEPRLEDKGFLLRMPGGAVVITWTRKASTDSVQATEVTSQLRVGMDAAKNEFTVNCRMSIQGPRRLGGRSFSIELPPDCLWKSRLSSTALMTGYKLIPVLDSPREQIVEIDDSISQSEFEIALEWVGKLPQENSPIAIALPRVKEATRHSGTVMINLGRSQSLLWDPQDGIMFSRTATTDSADFFSNNFYLQDASLVLKYRIAKEQALPAIRADHRVQVLSDRIFLTTIIEFKEDVRNLPFLQWEGKGWALVNAVVLSSGKQLNNIQQVKPGDDFAILPIPIADLNEGGEAATSSAVGESVIGKRVLVQCVRSITNPDGPLINESASPFDIDLNIPVVSWLDETTQSRRIWSPSGATRFESSFYQLRNRDAEMDNVPSVGLGGVSSVSLLDSVSNDSRLISMGRISPRSTLNSFARGDQDSQFWRMALKPLQPEIESNETIRIMSGRGVRGFEQEWLLRSKGGFPDRLLLAFPKHWFKSDSNLAEGVFNGVESSNRLFELSLNGSALDTLEALSEDDADRLYLRLPASKPEHIWVKVNIPEFLRSQISEDTPSLLTLSMRDDLLRESQSSNASEQVGYSFAVLDSGVAKSRIQQQSCVCLVLSEPEKRLVIENVAYSTSSTEIRIGNDIWKQTRLDLPFDSVKLNGFLVAQDPNKVGSVRLEKAWVHSIVQNKSVRHRVVFRVFTQDPSIRIRSSVPFDADIEVSVNGEQAASSVLTENKDELVIERNVASVVTAVEGSGDSNAKLENQEPWVIELFFWEQINGTFWQVINMPNLEIIGQGDTSAPVLWQVLTPATEHVLASSESLSSQNHWKWSKFWFARLDSRQQSEMESWIGASEQPVLELPLAQYAMAAVSISQPRWIYLVPVYVVWFPIGSATLLFSGLLFHIRWMRNPWTLLGYVILFIGLASWWLDVMILFAQVMIMTGVFALAAMLIAWMLDRSTRRRTVLAGRGTTIGSFSQRSGGKSDSKIDSKQVGSPNPIDQLPTTISPNVDVARGGNGELEHNGQTGESLSGGSSVRGAVR